MWGFICDFVYHQDHRIEMTEVVVTDLWEANEWMERAFLELHLDSHNTPDLLRLRSGDRVLASWEARGDSVG